MVYAAAAASVPAVASAVLAPEAAVDVEEMGADGRLLLETGERMAELAAGKGRDDMAASAAQDVLVNKARCLHDTAAAAAAVASDVAVAVAVVAVAAEDLAAR